jgi:hypothetical protein
MRLNSISVRGKWTLHSASLFSLFTALLVSSAAWAVTNEALNTTNPAVPAANICDPIKHPIYAFNITASGTAPVPNLTSVSFTTNAGYAGPDIIKFQLWHNATNDLNTAIQLGGDIITLLGPGSHTFSGLSLPMPAPNSEFFWITTDISPSFVAGNTISVAAMSTANLTYTAGTQSGGGFPGGIQTIVITPPQPGSISGSSTVCDGANGLTYSITPLSGSFTYNWSVPSEAFIVTGQGTNSILVNMGSSSGNVSVVANNACGDGPARTLPVTVNPNPSPAPQVSASPVCEGGSVTLQGFPSGMASYSWIGPNGFSSSDQNPVIDPVQLTHDGDYFLSVVSPSGCNGNPNSVHLDVNSSPVASIDEFDNALCNNSTGSAIVSVTGGSTPYSYSWTNGETTQTAFSLPAGSYSVTVTDANGCSAIDDVTITEPSAILVVPGVTDAGCNVADGAIDLTVSGGVSPYNFSWSNEETTEDISNLSPGNYDVTVTDFNGCSVFVEDIGVGEPVIAIPDANFKAALLANGDLNTNSDGEIQCSEASGYSGTIEVQGQSISDLTGIGSLVSIISLECGNNNLTTLDVSANTALTSLFCYNNQLTSLDVSESSLNTLSCYGNQLTSLNIANATALSYLACDHNQLTSLDVSTNTALSELIVHNNQLSTIDLSSNTALWRIECQSNNLASLDISNNTLIAIVGCGDNEITSLDASGNPALTHFSCPDNQLTSLNIANGFNTNIPSGEFSAYNNPSLTCIQVDDVSYSNTNWIGQIDEGASFSTSCSPSTPGAALNLDGSGDVAVGPENLIPISGPYTVSVWAKQDAFSSGGLKNIISQGRHFYIGPLYNDTLRIGDDWYATGFAWPQDTEWHNYAVVRSDTNTYFYFDGVLAATAGFGIQSPHSEPLYGNPQAIFYVGAQWYGNGEFWNGSVDELRIWNRQLSALEIAEYLNCEIPNGAEGLIANYHFNQGYAGAFNSDETFVHDATLNENDLELQGLTLNGNSSNWIEPGAVTTGENCNICSNPDVPFVSSALICAGTNATLEVTSGYLNSATDWHWYTGSCGDSLIGTGSSITVSPDSTTTYYVRGEGGCITAGSCGSGTVSVGYNPTPVIAQSGPLCTENGYVVLSLADTTDIDTYAWTPGGETTDSIVLDDEGTFGLSVTTIYGCSASASSVSLVFETCITPYYEAPDSGGTEEPIGSELTQLASDPEQVTDTATSANNIFQISEDQGSVLIEVVAIDGQYEDLLALLQTPDYGMTDIIDNGENTLKITGFFPIANLTLLNELPEMIDQVYNFLSPTTNATLQGVTVSRGDVAMRSDSARMVFGVDGDGVKVGVISNSYNTIPGNPAGTNVANGDLPGTGNAQNSNDVEVIAEYPYGTQSDEGRAMLQIVHDVAPKASLAFASGFISSGNMAAQIRALRDNACDVIVDDVTFLNEPFYQDGVIAQAVDEVTNDGVAYFSAAGNFGNQSYENMFSGVSAPSGYTGEAHNFANAYPDSTDIYQSISLTAGVYTIVMQWEDSIYSLGQLPGARTDLDIYLVDNFGTRIFGFNRNNIGADPIEVMPFIVRGASQANIMVIKKSGIPAKFKYIVFRGQAVINEYNSGTGTCVGQANAEGAMAVGAVLYSNTPSYGVDPPTIASFSSRGGVEVYNTDRQKPDFTAPNGVNTTVSFGSLNIDSDAFPNFFGTSAAAPHAAAVAALLIDAKQRFYSQDMSPAEVRSLLSNTAIDMDVAGYDINSGNGFIQADAAILTFAKPTPVALSLSVPDGVTPGAEEFSVTVNGSYFDTSSVVVLRDDTLSTTYVSSNELTAVVPIFTGNPPVHVFTAAYVPNSNDGGESDSLYFNSSYRPLISIVADDKTKRYGEQVPTFTSTILVDGQTLAEAGLDSADVGLDNIAYTTPANSTSNADIYYIQPEATLSVELNELYQYEFTNGLLTIQKMPLVIKPNDMTVLFGDQIDGREITFEYTFDDSNIDASELADFTNSLTDSYEGGLVKEVALLDDRTEVDGNTLSEAELANLAIMSGSRAIANGSRAIANASRAIANGDPYPDTTYIVDLPYESLIQYYDNDGEAADLVDSVTVLNGSRAIANGSRGIVNTTPLTNGSVLINGSRAIANASRAIANASRGIVNGEELDGSSNTNTAVIIHEDDLDVEENPDSSYQLISINCITGLTAGDHFIVPGGFLSSNFDVSYELGTLHIDPYPLTVEAGDASVEYGTAPSYTSTISGYQYDDVAADVYTGTVSYSPDANSQINAGAHAIVPSGLTLIEPSNYVLDYDNAGLEVSRATLTATADNKVKIQGTANPTLTISYDGFKYSDDENVISPPLTISTTAVTSSPVGTYPITLGLEGIAANYNIVRVNGTMTVVTPVTCSITTPSPLPVCGLTGNILTATATGANSYSWSVSGAGWAITAGQGTLSITYTAGNSGVNGVFTLTSTNTEYGFSSVCTLSVGTRCEEYCSYGQGFWGNPTSGSCSGATSGSMLPGLLSTPLVNGWNTRTVTIGTTESSCLQSKLPTITTPTSLPNGSVTCATATGNSYIAAGKFKNVLLGNEIALALAVRANPALGNLRITGPYVTSYAATSCVEGKAIPGTQTIYSIPQRVITALGSNNRISDLITLANKSLGNAISNPSAADLNSALNSILYAFNQCRILAGFSSSSVGSRIEDAEAIGQQLNSLLIYPNPTSENATVAFIGDGNRATLEVYSMNGGLSTQIFDQATTTGEEYKVDINSSSWAAGVYFMRLTLGNEVTFGKLVIMK